MRKLTETQKYMRRAIGDAITIPIGVCKSLQKNATKQKAAALAMKDEFFRNRESSYYSAMEDSHRSLRKLMLTYKRKARKQSIELSRICDKTNRLLEELK